MCRRLVGARVEGPAPDARQRHWDENTDEDDLCGDETHRLMMEAFGPGYLPSGVGARLVFETATDSSGNPLE